METYGISGVEEADSVILSSLEIDSFTKSWIVFHKLGLSETSLREELQSGFQPWNAPNIESLWVYQSQNMTSGPLTVEEAKAEWNSFMRYWLKQTLQNMKMEILSTSAVTAQQQPTLKLVMIDSGHPSLIIIMLNIFVQPITENMYNSLRILNYKYLYKSNNTYNILFGPGILARRSNSNTAFVHSTGIFSEVLMQYNYGCGNVYNFDEEELAYYDGVYLRLLNEEDEGIIKTNNVQDNVTRTSLEVEKTTILSKLAFVAQDDNRMFSRGEEIVIKII